MVGTMQAGQVESVSNDASGKRSRETSGGKVEWSITFDQVQEVYKLLQIVANVLDYVTIRVCANPPRIEIDHIDKKKICMVQARLVAASIEGVHNEVTFCVKTKSLLACLGSAQCTCSVVLQQVEGSSDIEMHCFDPFGNAAEDDAVIKTVMDDTQSMSVQDMNYSYTVVMKLKCLRKLLKTAQEVNADTLRMQMYKSTKPKKSTLVDQTASTTSVLACRFVCEGGEDATSAKTFVSEVSENDDNVIRTEEQPPMAEKFNRHDADMCYNELFPLQYINYFVKAMDREKMTMKIGYDADTKEALPLVIEYPLDPENTSYINFVLAVLNDME